MISVNIIALFLVFAPLIAAILVGLNTKKIGDLGAQIITSGSVIFSAICATLIFKDVAIEGDVVHISLLTWFAIGDFFANWAIYIDVLTAVMLVVVTYVSALVHVYSIGYMSHDAHKPRFMCYLSLFTFCMLMLVTSDNFIQLFFGWEGVGVCSYLLIGFWYKKPSANAAAMKAFLVNRVGDFGFALGIFAIYLAIGSVEYSIVFEEIHTVKDSTIMFFSYEVNYITFACLLLFMGAMGKSAQLGLHTWLPDAMEGPTPVSALIHAATMVTAGVFLVARCSPIFEYSETALTVITIIGAFTCFFAATVALVQNDIKKIIAYSTCSQLGYMFFACGVSAYSAGVFHLATHGFFKALLFLGAGSVIHAMSDEQDIRKMGGIWKLIPFTYVMMWIGSLALAGIYPFAGYFSKDTILEAAAASGNPFGIHAYTLGVLAAIMTAFYSWRLLIMTFHGKPNASKETMDHVHESPLNMTIPLFLLAIGAIASGYFGFHYLGMVHESGEFWRGSIKVFAHNNSLEAMHHISHIYALIPLFAAVAGILTAYVMYMFTTGTPSKLAKIFSSVYVFLSNKWYFDELYEFAFVKSSKSLGKLFWKKADMKLVDGMPNGAAKLSEIGARFLSRAQTGFVYHYATVMLLGIIALISWTLFMMG